MTNLVDVAALARTERLGEARRPQKAARSARGSWTRAQPADSHKIPVPPYNKELPREYWENLKRRNSDKASYHARARGRPWLLPVGLVAFAGWALWGITAKSLRQAEFPPPHVSVPTVPLPPPPGLFQLAEKVPPRVLRAALVTPRRIVMRALPVQSHLDPPIGVSFDAHMPYGETVHATFMGRLPSQASLPSTGAFIGETLAIGNQEFVWTAPFGGVPQWIDP